MLRTSSVLYNVQCTLYIVQCRVHFECNTGVSVVGMLRTSCVLYNVHCTMYNAEYIFNVIHYYEPRGVSCRYAQVSNAPRMLNLFASLLFSQILHEICTAKAHQQCICFTLRSHKYAKIKSTSTTAAQQK